MSDELATAGSPASPATAIGLSFAATAATVAGAAAPLLTDLVKRKLSPSGPAALHDPKSPVLSDRFFAFVYATAAGALIFGSLADVLPNAVTAWSSVESVGKSYAILTAFASFFMGVAAFLIMETALKALVPDFVCPCHRAEVVCACEPDSGCGCDREAARRKASRVSWMSLLAMTLHHIPEGLAFYITATSNLEHGAVIGIILLVHVFPEGLSVGGPAFVAFPTQPWRCLVHGLVAGLATPLGAVIGYLAFQSAAPDALALGLTYGAIAGMLVTLSVRGLLPQARMLDPKDSVASAGVFIGLSIVFFSLGLFSVAGFEG